MVAGERHRDTKPGRRAACFIAGALLLTTALLASACGGEDEGSSDGGTPFAPATPIASGTVGLAWYGHSMFLLQSPNGINIVMDPNSGIGYPKPALPKVDLVVTTYGVMLRDIQFLHGYEFHYAILDESQSIKNPLSQTARAAHLLRARHRLALTGTPIENSTAEASGRAGSTFTVPPKSTKRPRTLLIKCFTWNDTSEWPLSML